MTLTTLVVGSRASIREAAIAAALKPEYSTALILEGLPDGNTSHHAFDLLSPTTVIRIAPGCLCCTGNLTMRVTLNRIFRHPPARLYISLATASHIDQLRHFLIHPPYDALLTLTDDLHV